MCSHRQILVERIAIAELFDLAVEWDSLSRKSAPDHIFLSRAWMISWWECWGSKQVGAEAFGLVARDETNQLVGIAPLYYSHEVVQKFIRVRRLQFLGSSFRKANVTRTEYFDILADPAVYSQVVDKMLCEVINDCSFDEFIVSDVVVESEIHGALVDLAKLNSLVTRQVDRDEGVCIQLDGTFEAYVRTLGAGTRRRIFNRRSILESIEGFELVNFEFGDLDAGLQILEELSLIRWGSSLRASGQLTFHKTLQHYLKGSGATPKLSAIRLRDKWVSVLLNVRFGSTEYNLLSAIADDIHPKLSIGMLHLGYAIETAFKDGLARFDLLLGRGKKSNYKRHFGGHAVKSETLQIIRKPVLKLAYRMHDALPGPFWKTRDRPE